MIFMFSKTKLSSELLGFWTSSIVQYSKKLENRMFWKLDLFPPSDEAETPTVLGPLESAKLNNCVLDDGQSPKTRYCVD
jgi:hypothetical protein